MNRKFLFPVEEPWYSQTMSENEIQEPQADQAEDAESPGLLDLTEDMAGRAIQKLKETASLPRVAEEATTKATRFFSSLNTFGLRFVTGVYVLTALFGVGTALVGVEPIGTLPDWMMHVAMYGVCFGLLALYTTSHREERRMARSIFCAVAMIAFVTFALILVDRVDERLVFLENDLGTDAVSTMRPRMPLLWGPAVMLIICAISVLFHWLFADPTKKESGNA